MFEIEIFVVYMHINDNYNVLSKNNITRGM